MVITITNTLHIQIQAEWIADYFKGSFLVPYPHKLFTPFASSQWGKSVDNTILATLPPRELMRRETAARWAWTWAQIGDLGRPGFLLVSQGPRYIELLLNDMGLPSHSKFDLRKQLDLPVPQDLEYMVEAKRRRDAGLKWV